MTVPHLT